MSNPMSNPMSNQIDPGYQLPGIGSRIAALVRQLFVSQLRTTLTWGAVLGALGTLYVLLFPAMNENMNMDEYLQNLPEELKAFIPSISGSIDTLPGWLDLEMFSLIAPFSLPFFVIIMGARAIAGREENGRIDLLLSNPIPRWSLVLATLVNMTLALSVALAVIGAFTWLPTLLIEGELGVGQLLNGLVSLIPFSLFFGALALVLSSIVRRSSTAIALPGVLLVAMYVANGLGSYNESFELVQPLSLFHYLGTPLQDGVTWGFFGVTLLLALGLTALAAVLFERREIHT